MRKIAVTYDNEMIFEHFGRTENFKIYEVEGTEVIGAKIIDSNGAGHEALAGVLAGEGIDTLICGGIGAGAEAALSEAGIEVVSGASGDADVTLLKYLHGDLNSEGINCDHHDSEDEEGGCGGCGGGSCGCGGGCHSAPKFEGKNVGKTLRVHYRGTFNDGTQFDSSYDRGEPLEFVCGAGMMILGFDKACANMEVGEKVKVHLMPEEAYGPKDPNAIITVDIARMPGAEELNIDDHVYLTNIYGQEFPVVVIAKNDVTITFDANSEMAGKELNFDIELVEIQ